MRMHKLLTRLYRDVAAEGGDPGAAAPAAPAAPIVVPSFADSIPAEYRESPGLKDYKDISGLIKSHLNLQTMVGDSIKVPKEMTAENLAPIWDKLGRPKTAGEYNFSLEGDLKEVKLNQDMTDWAKQLFHKHGLNPQQANGLMQEYVAKEQGTLAQQQEAQESQALEWEDKLRDDFGDKFDEKVTLAQRAANMFTDQETRDWLETSGLGNNPNFVKTFAKIGALLQEDKAFADGSGAAGFVASEGEAKLEIGKLNADPTFMKAYMNGDAPGHRDAVQRMQKLYGVAYPGKQKN